MQHPEHIQQVKFFQIMDFLSDIPESALTFAVPNGAKFISTRHGAIVKAEGMRKGVPDILLPAMRRGYAGLAIEMKIPPNKCTADQVKFQKMLRDEKWHVVDVCKSAEGAYLSWAWYVDLDASHRDRVERNFFPEDVPLE